MKNKNPVSPDFHPKITVQTILKRQQRDSRVKSVEIIITDNGHWYSPSFTGENIPAFLHYQTNWRRNRPGFVTEL